MRSDGCDESHIKNQTRWRVSIRESIWNWGFKILSLFKTLWNWSKSCLVRQISKKKNPLKGFLDWYQVKSYSILTYHTPTATTLQPQIILLYSTRSNLTYHFIDSTVPVTDTVQSPFEGHQSGGLEFLGWGVWSNYTIDEELEMVDLKIEVGWYFNTYDRCI